MTRCSRDTRRVCPTGERSQISIWLSGSPPFEGDGARHHPLPAFGHPPLGGEGLRRPEWSSGSLALLPFRGGAGGEGRPTTTLSTDWLIEQVGKRRERPACGSGRSCS